jgi:hypothetical protein
MDENGQIVEEVVRKVEQLPSPPPANEVADQIREFLRRLIEQRPQDWAELFSDLTALHFIAGIALCVAGMAYLLWGWRVFKFLVMLNVALLGAIFSGAAVIQLHWENYFWIGLLAGGVLGGVLAWPLMKLFVALFGGALGATFGAEAFRQIAAAAGRGDLAEYAWAAAILGAVVLGLAVFFTFRLCVMIITAIQGAGMLAAGVLSLLFKWDWASGRLTEFLLETPLVLPLCVVGVALAGFLIQIFSRAGFRSGQAKAKAK